MRARIDVSEVEATTKIRAKYLRALENEEWGLLPGPTFVKSFLRTYADALGLDGRAMVEDYRLHHESPSDAMLEPIVSTPQRNRRRRPPSGPSRGYIAAVAAVGLLIVVLVVALVSGGGPSSHTASKGTPTHSAGTAHPNQATHPGTTGTSTSGAPVVALSLKPTGVINVCLIGEGGRRLIAGVDLQPGESTATFHSRRFVVTLGNNSVTMYIDGRPRSVPASASAIGYTITKARGRQPLASSQLPTCK